MIDEKFLGIPYKIGGRTLEAADCIGVTVLWLKSEGIEADYDDSKGPVMSDWWVRNPRRLLEAVLQFGTVVRFAEIKKYDVLMLSANEQGVVPGSIAVMVDDRHLLTSNEERGSFVEMLDMQWKNRFWGGIRLNKVAEKEL